MAIKLHENSQGQVSVYNYFTLKEGNFQLFDRASQLRNKRKNNGNSSFDRTLGIGICIFLHIGEFLLLNHTRGVIWDYENHSVCLKTYMVISNARPRICRRTV